MRANESALRNHRILGVLALAALGLTGGCSVAGIVLVVVLNDPDEQAIAATTALSSIASTAIGALAGWTAGRRSSATSDKAEDGPITS